MLPHVDNAGDKKLFHVSTKGLVFRDGKIMLLHETSGIWDLPGGRMEHGEDFESALQRECQEEMGVNCTLLDDQPFWTWTSQDHVGRWRVTLCFRIELESFNFHESDECVGYDFFDRAKLDEIEIYESTKRVKDFL